MDVRKFFVSVLLLIIFVLTFQKISSAQQDTIKYLWPLAPMNIQKNISGTFGEYRSTTVDGHYHNGTDVPAPAGTPVYAVLPGVVAAAYNDGSTGYDSYVRVTSQINGQSKNITYYHTNPSVSVGQSVAVGQQVSTIAIDHVHIIDYRLGSSLVDGHLNAIRPNGGLANYIDTWKPHIRYVKFFLDNSTTQLSTSSLGSKVDIIAHIEEVNGTSSSAQNNGTYRVGYKILSADKKTVVYNPPDDGLRYEYYNLPSNSYVNVNYFQQESSTSKHVYIVTNGTGASDVANTRIVSNNFWNVNSFPYGNYTVMVYTQDVRGNADTVYIPVTTTDIDLIPPAPPVLSSLVNDSTSHFDISWIASPDSDLKGYRLYYSIDGDYFNTRDNEDVLNNAVTNAGYAYNQTAPLYLKLTAVDSATLTNESDPSDTYGIRMMNDGVKILIVDGFDRIESSGSWHKPYHNFIVKYAEAFNKSFESCSNDEVINGDINLNDYQLVFWLLGDESTKDETFSDSEQSKVKSYLENGGKLFVSGSEIAWDLEGSGSASSNDISFLHNYLKAKFVKDNSNIYGVYGVESSGFDSLAFSYGITSQGSPYIEDFPDEIDTSGGSFPILSYNKITTAGIAYKGSFNNSQKEGSVIYLAFPFETISSLDARRLLLADAFKFFNLSGAVNVANQNLSPAVFYLSQNYPNPFNPSTVIEYSVPSVDKNNALVKLSVFDILGREVAVLVNEQKSAGNYKVVFDASKLGSGVYFYKLDMGSNSVVKKMILLK